MKQEWVAYSFNYPLVFSYSVKTRIVIENEQTSNSSCEKLYGLFLGSKLIFQLHIDNICKKVSKKLNAISRLTMDNNQ